MNLNKDYMYIDKDYDEIHYGSKSELNIDDNYFTINDRNKIIKDIDTDIIIENFIKFLKNYQKKEETKETEYKILYDFTTKFVYFTVQENDNNDYPPGTIVKLPTLDFKDNITVFMRLYKMIDIIRTQKIIFLFLSFEKEKNKNCKNKENRVFLPKDLIYKLYIFLV